MLVRTLFGVFAFSAIAFAGFADDKILSLPGLSFEPNFDQYSGFLRAFSADGYQKLWHYWLTESPNPTKDPLVVWLNGGPGCSSLIGLMEEPGPFRVKDFGRTIYQNEYSWNRFANILFLESPAGVGWSYSTNGNITTSDDQVSLDNYNSLLDFFTKFPEYKGREFWITGESYAGVYIPTLAMHILKDSKNFPNFKGVAIGNGALNFPNNYNTMIPLYYYHALVRDGIYNKIAAECCNNNIETCDIFGNFNVEHCRPLLIDTLDSTNELNMYNLYDTCYYNPNGSDKRAIFERTMRRNVGLPQRKHNAATTIPLCAQTNGTFAYLNRPDVRKALHIPSSLPLWQECSDPVEKNYGITHFDVIPEFQAMIKVGKRILVYNGDVDTACNSIMNQQFLTSLNLTLPGAPLPNKPWHYNGETGFAVAGFQTRFNENIDFLTVRGSGHFVPEDKPRESRQMIYNFIHNLDYSTPVPF